MTPEIVEISGGKEFASPLEAQQKLCNIVDTEFRRPWLDEVKRMRGKHHLPYLAARNYNPEWLRENTQKIFFDIEGYLTPDGQNDGFGLATTIDEHNEARLWERHELTDFLDYLLQFDEVVSFAGLGFDNWAIAKEVGPDDPRVQELYNRTFDLQQFVKVASPVKLRHPLKLDTVAKKTISKQKLDLAAHGFSSESIPDILSNGKQEQKEIIRSYCLQDTVLVRDIYNFYRPTLAQKQAMLEGQIRNTAEGIYQADANSSLLRPFEIVGEAPPLGPWEFEKPITVLIGIDPEEAENSVTITLSTPDEGTAQPRNNWRADGLPIDIPDWD